MESVTVTTQVKSVSVVTVGSVTYGFSALLLLIWACDPLVCAHE
jgi:hypothetical protein